MNNHTHVSSNIGNGTENEVATITLNKSNCLSESGHNTITTFGCSKNKSISPNITKGGCFGMVFNAGPHITNHSDDGMNTGKSEIKANWDRDKNRKIESRSETPTRKAMKMKGIVAEKLKKLDDLNQNAAKMSIQSTQKSVRKSTKVKRNKVSVKSPKMKQMMSPKIRRDFRRKSIDKIDKNEEKEDKKLPREASDG